MKQSMKLKKNKRKEQFHSTTDEQCIVFCGSGGAFQI